MLKIPELPIYNTERYTNFSPISPDDIRPGHIYTNDSLFLYVSHFSFNKTAGYSVWDKDGEYISTDIFTSYNIYAIVTYLNNNNFRPLDYDFEVVDPYNIEKRLLLTPHGIKDVNNVEENFIRGKICKLIEKNVRQLLKEHVNGDFGTNDNEDLSPFEEYKQDYPNDDFDVSNMTAEKLAKWCQNAGDFLYIYKGLRGLSIKVANTNNIVSDIVNDLYNCDGIEPTHEVDYLFTFREGEFENNYVCIFKIFGTKDGDYYIVYQTDKNDNLNIMERKIIKESFNSNRLRNWFKQHGGVKKTYDNSNMRMMQDGLGDVSDDDIVYFQEFNNRNDAANTYSALRRKGGNVFHTIYTANDGCCLIVGFDRNKMDTGFSWGGEHTRKKADRIWRDERGLNASNDGYRYSKAAQRKGVYNDENYRQILQQRQGNTNNRNLDRMIAETIEKYVFKRKLNEAFKSNELRNWFKLHGGVKKYWDEFPDMSVMQDGLSDISDEDILYLQEFSDIKDARREFWDLSHKDENGRRARMNNRIFYIMYKANDGYCLIVGVNRNNIETGINWGGEHTKKKSDRIWRDDKDGEAMRAGRYIDDRDRYYYSRKGQDFGLWTNKNYKGKMKDNQQIKSRMSDEEWKEFQKQRVNDMHSYLDKYYK